MPVRLVDYMKLDPSTQRSLMTCWAFVAGLGCQTPGEYSSPIEATTAVMTEVSSTLEEQRLPLLDRYRQPLDLERFPELGSIADQIHLHTPSSWGADQAGLALTIDSSAQEISQRLLESAVQESEVREGVVIVMDPSTGELLALAHARGDTSQDSTKASERSGHPALMNDYEPGSMMKPLIVAFAVEEGELNRDSKVAGYEGSYKVGKHTVKDAKPVSYMTPVELISNSSNVGAVQVSHQLGVYRHDKYLRHLGFGKRTGLGLGEQEGKLTNLQALKERKARLISAYRSFGYGMSATPLQVTRAMAVIANGGYLVKPRLIMSEGVEPNDRVRVLGDQAIAIAREGLEQAVSDGTAQAVNVEGAQVAGKSATTRLFNKVTQEYQHGSYQSAFIGYGRTQDPRYLIYVLLDSVDVRHGPWQASTELFSMVMRGLLSRDQVRPAYALDPEEQFLP